METLYDYKQYAVLYVDDEEMSLKYFRKAFEGSFRILTASTAEEGFRILQEKADDIGVVMSDQRMPGEKGTKFLERVRQFRPRTIRILATAFSDLDAAIEAVNVGAIYRYVTKPWDVPELETTLKRGLEFFIVQHERDLLVREKLSVLHGVVMTDRVLSLGVLAAGVTSRVRNAMRAVQAFLDVVPDRNRKVELDLHQLRQPDLWREFRERVHNRVKLALDLLGPPSAEPRFRFETSSKPGDLVGDVAKSIQKELDAKQISVSFDIPADLPAIMADRPKMERMILCLLRNALMRLPDGARIRVAAKLAKDDAGGPQVELRISDQGPGIPEDAILALFDPFASQTSPRHEFGVYLLAAYFVAYHHGGAIEVHSGNDGSVEQVIRLPVTPPADLSELEADRFMTQAIINDRLWDKLLT